MDVDYHILLNRTEDEEGRLAIFTRFRSEDTYQPDDTLEYVFSGWIVIEPGNEEHILDLLFERFNRGAPGFIGDERYPQRSLSAGDVVEVNGRRFACQRIGWIEIAPAADADYSLRPRPGETPVDVINRVLAAANKR
jgi:hypothetical protein